MQWFRSVLQGVWGFLRGFGVFVARHPDLVVEPALRVALIQLCRTRPEYADQIEAALRKVAEAVGGGQVKSPEEAEELMEKVLSDIGVDDPFYASAVMDFMDAFNAALSSYIQMRGHNLGRFAKILNNLADSVREFRRRIRKGQTQTELK